ncbi:recombinase family protein [Massilia aerilata]|uniref:Recombinase family protein n=1 Tax=Massilia aerilata TaxID=453817 RepID=A0ABW0RXX3_9BURK
MANGKYISYIRVSTSRQGASGLGLEAQRQVVARFLNGGEWQLVGEFQEVESGRKVSRSRPQLMGALAACKREKATLIIAKIDRLSRDVRFFLEVLDDSGVNIRFADFQDVDPKTDEGRMLLINLASFAEYEGRRIGARTKAALAVAKARGVKLGTSGAVNLRPNIEQRQASADAFAEKLRPIFAGMASEKLSQRGMVDRLNAVGIPTSTGEVGKWRLSQVQRILGRLDA